MKIYKVRDVKTPTRGTSKSAGIDFYVPNSFKQTLLSPHCDILIPSGIKANIGEGLMLMGAEKSGVTTSNQAVVAAGRMPKEDGYLSATILGAKIVDEDYQGEIHIHIINTGDHDIVITPGKKIAQFILVPVRYDDIEEVATEEELFSGIETERGEGGFGSTGEE